MVEIKDFTLESKNRGGRGRARPCPTHFPPMYAYMRYMRDQKLIFFNFLVMYINTCTDFKYYFTLQKICLYARIPNSNYHCYLSIFLCFVGCVFVEDRFLSPS